MEDELLSPLSSSSSLLNVGDALTLSANIPSTEVVTGPSQHDMPQKSGQTLLEAPEEGIDGPTRYHRRAPTSNREAVLTSGNMKREEKKKGGNRKRKEAFIYGNYRYYYGYRIDRNMEEDLRLSVLRREWFEGKDCLDVGCNQGLITIAIAKKFSCRSILGVDIDAGLIDTANWNLRKISMLANTNKKRVTDLNCSRGGVSHALHGQAFSPERVETPSQEANYLETVSFRHENFVESLNGCLEEYDTVICFSVSKWVHLNWGDAGLVTLFAKVWRLLKQGGVFLLEPQPWSSYENNRLVSETAKTNFSNITLYPWMFSEILLDKIGFRSSEAVTDGLSGAATGFDRPIIAFYK